MPPFKCVRTVTLQHRQPEKHEHKHESKKEIKHDHENKKSQKNAQQNRQDGKIRISPRKVRVEALQTNLRHQHRTNRGETSDPKHGATRWSVWQLTAALVRGGVKIAAPFGAFIIKQTGAISRQWLSRSDVVYSPLAIPNCIIQQACLISTLSRRQIIVGSCQINVGSAAIAILHKNVFVRHQKCDPQSSKHCDLCKRPYGHIKKCKHFQST
mmetsp:Transcript_14253/g.21527  ORF Transcript_14253/g.21527 Transcript_14253/m.21527 type:complete len:212 (+) Transcript_14253:1138-1773(+)